MAKSNAPDHSAGMTVLALGAAAILGVALTVYGYRSNDSVLLAGGLIAVVMVVVVLPLALRVTTRDPSDRLLSQMAEMNRRLEEMANHNALSDDARRVLNRDQERDLLCRAIREDISKEDWDAAMVLCEELAERFGYREEAERFRQEVDAVRADAMDRRVIESIHALDAMIAAGRWHDALLAAQRLERLYPESPRIDGVRDRISRAQAQYKVDLERRFLLAAEEERAEEALEMLKELDQYLTPQEAAPFSEVARGVISKARDNLGARFKLALQDHRWAEASEIGEQIISEFPNTLMAKEVRQMLSTLRERAGV